MNKKNNILYFNTKNKKKGIALLFSIMLSAILLFIAFGVLNISVKQLNFRSLAKDTNEAFFAADTGIECALYNDKSGSITFSGTEADIPCFDNVFPLTSNVSKFDFTIDSLGSNGKSCVKVTVDKSISPNTKVISKGYNLGGDNSCIQTGLQSTERIIEVNY